FIERASDQAVLVRSPDAERLGEGIPLEGGQDTPGGGRLVRVGGREGGSGEAIALEGGKVTRDGDGVLGVAGMEVARIGELASAGGFVLQELAPKRSSLE